MLMRASANLSSSPLGIKNQVLVLGFGGFDHKRPRHWERHSWGMEAIIHQSFGYVLFTDTSLFLKLTEINDKLMAASITVFQIHDVEIWS